jgi:hypothetical protein
LIMLTAGLGGLAWAISFFFYFAIFQASANIADDSNSTVTSFRTSDGTTTTTGTGATQNGLQVTAIVLLISTICFLLVDMALISFGGWNLSKNKVQRSSGSAKSSWGHSFAS